MPLAQWARSLICMSYLRHAWILLALVGTAPAATAQTYPDYTSTTVNDFADLLPEAEERQLSERLEQLEENTGVEMTVVTLPTQGAYAPAQSLEAFATGLFDDWGVGKAETNDGVMVLILRDDRAMRLELGAAYGRDWDRVAQSVVDDVFLPAFRDEAYLRGILSGSTVVIERIVIPFHNGTEPPSVSTSEDDGNLGFLAAIIGLFGVFAGRRTLSDQITRLRRCPQCGRRGLTRVRNVITPASFSITGSGEAITRCKYCGYEDRQTYVISRRRRSSGSGSFGGGRSGGGGASGRW